MRRQHVPPANVERRNKRTVIRAVEKRDKAREKVVKADANLSTVLDKAMKDGIPAKVLAKWLDVNVSRIYQIVPLRNQTTRKRPGKEIT
jgi:hypothetical protein